MPPFYETLTASHFGLEVRGTGIGINWGLSMSPLFSLRGRLLTKSSLSSHILLFLEDGSFRVARPEVGWAVVPWATRTAV